MRDITLRQIEVIRAVMLRGTINGAADHLNVSAPGISRLIKHAESSLGLRLFERKGGYFVPSNEAQLFFDQIREVYKNIENLQTVLGSLKQGAGVSLKFASAPSVGTYLTPKAVGQIRKIYPELYIDINIVKYEEAIDYVLMEQGEFALMSSPVDHPSVDSRMIGRSPVRVVLPKGHPLTECDRISINQLKDESITGIDPLDPYGVQLYQPFKDAGLDKQYATRGRFGQTVIALVREHQGIALIDEMSVMEPELSGVEIRPLVEEYFISVYVYTKSGSSQSTYAIEALNAIESLLTPQN
jgi:DNA-binding transcriptional LysR family regulator